MTTLIPPHPRHKWGQNFLKDQNVLRKLTDFCELSPADTVLEIGAGTGALTSLIAPRVGRLIAVEIDESLLPYLSKIPHAEILHADIRKIDVCSFAHDKRIRVIGNLPYYISTPILTSLIAERKCIQDMVLMFQEEVARRILASPSDPDYGMLSVIAQYFCDVNKGFKVSRNCFAPKPEVDSRVLRFYCKQDRMIEYETMADFLAKSFSQRRKKLRNNLLRTVGVSETELDAAFSKLKIAPTARAENLASQEYENLILMLRH